MIARPSFQWGRRLLPLLAVVLPLIAVACSRSSVGNYWTFRSEEGGWAFPVIRSFDMRPLRVFLVLTPIVILLLRLTERRLAKWIWPRVLLWQAFGLAIQRAIGTLAPDTLHQLIESDTANGFYSPTLQYPIRTFLSSYSTFTMWRHAETNMPGKVLFFYFLKPFTDSTEMMGYLVILISNLGALLTFVIARRLLKNDRAAFYSMVLYLLIPGKTIFFPVLNVVTPVFLLVCFWSLILFLDSRNIRHAIGLGVGLYLLLLFDPIPYVLGLMFLAFVIKYWLEQKIDVAGFAKLAATAIVTFVVVHETIFRLFDFSVLRAFQLVSNVNSNFNLGRPYRIWVFGDAWEFFVQAGVVQSLLTIGFCAVILRQVVRAASAGERTQTLLDPAHLLSVSFLIAFLVLDLSGLNRGESSRMWIFMMVFPQIVTGYLCAVKLPRAVTDVVVATTIFQTAATIYTVGVLLP